MQIAIVSDSHGSLDRLDELFRNLEKKGINNIIHAGDFACEGVLEILEKYPELNISIASGNCDVNAELLEKINQLPNCEVKSIILIKIENILIAASHIEGIAENVLQDKNIQVFCHGHTHRVKIEHRNNALILNPGALTEDGKYFLLSLPELKIEQKRFDEKI